MRKLIFSVLFLVAAQLFAQNPPSQFAGLLTNTTDLTCAGVVPCPTWPMPANPGMGGSYFDSTYGTTTWELNVPAQNTTGHVIPIYSRNQGFSSDNKFLMVQEPNGIYTDLYDATTTPPTPINRITTTDGTLLDTSAGDAYWANTAPTRIYYIPWGYTNGNWLQLRYVDVTNCTSSNCVLTPTTVHTFSCAADSYAPSPVTPGTAGNAIESSYTGSQGNMFDSTDTYFTFGCDYLTSIGSAVNIDLIRYNRSTDTVTTQVKWYTVCPGGVPSGCYIWTDPAGEMPHQGVNMYRMAQHPDANYITVAWMCSTDLNTNWHRGCGTEAFGPTWNYLGAVSVENVHQDDGFDVNGVPTWVGQETSVGNPSDYYSLEVVNLTTLSTTGITSKQLQLPCPYIYSGTPCPAHPFLGSKFNHISMTGTWGSVPGYALMSTGTQSGENGGTNVDMPLATTLGTAVSSPGVATVTPGTMAYIGVGTVQLIDWGTANVESVTVTSVTSTSFTATFAKTHAATAAVGSLSVGDTGPYAMENTAVKIDTTAADGSTAQIWRLGRVMSIRDGDYNAEAHSFVNRDWTAYIWGSNWSTDGGADNAYYTKLSTSGTGSGLSAAEISASAAPSPATVGQSVTLTATVAKTGSSIPTGSINFMVDGVSAGESSLDSEGTTTWSLSSLSVGSHSVIAVYSGDSIYATGESGSVSLQVQSPTTASLTATPNPVGAGQTLTLTATLTGDGSLWPTGTVSFMNGSTLLGTATLNASGVATLTTSSLAIGTYSLTAQYPGNTNFLSSNSAAVSVTVNAQATTTILTANPNPAASGQPLTLTATVQGTGSTASGGTVSFMNGSTLLGTSSLNSSGVATLTTSSLAIGTYSLTAQYAGNTNFLSSTSSVVSVTVSNQATTTSLTASPNPVANGQTLTLTATVQGTGSTTPGGTVSFFSGSTLLGTVTLNSPGYNPLGTASANSPGVATLTVTTLAAGSYSLTAQYSGNSNFLSSTSAAVSVTVNGQATTTSLTASPNPVTAGQMLTLTATVQGTGSTAPGGTVSFMSGSMPMGTAALNSSGIATLSTMWQASGSYNLTAQYAGNASFVSSTSAAVSVTVNAQATTTSLTASANQIAAGQTLTLTAAVQGNGNTAPGGTVTFMSGSTLLGTATLNSSGVATLSTALLASGTYSMTAQYAGNANFVSSTSAAVSVIVNAQATATSLTASANQIAAGQTLTLTAAVQGNGNTAPGGTVTFMSGSTLLGTATLNSSGVATLSTALLASGTYSMTAQYAGNANFVSSTSAAVSVIVNAQATATSLTASANQIAAGQTLTLTAAVQGNGNTVPGGTVNFMNGSVLLGTSTLNSSGVATFTTMCQAPGTYSMTAQFAGSANFLSSNSAAVSVTVNAQATTTNLTASPNAITLGQTLTLTAIVQGTGNTTPAGTVNFMSGSTLLGSATLNSSGVATLSTASLVPGTYSMTAQFAGSANFLSSNSAAVSVTVNAQATTTNLTASPNAITLGQTLTLTAIVQGTGNTTLAGTVNFMSGSTLLGSATLNSSGVATLTTTSLVPGTYSMTAQFAGSANFLSSNSAAVSVTVNAQATTTNLTASPNAITLGQTLTLTAIVQGTGNTTLAGTVNFMSGSTLLGSATLNSSGVATLTTTSLSAGNYSLTAQYGGNSSYLSSTSATVSVTVNAQSTTTSLSAAPNPVTSGQTLTLTAIVQGTGSTAPTGTVKFMNGSMLLGSAVLNSSGVATLTTATLATGSYSVTAKYGGNVNFLSSTSAAVSVTVRPQPTTPFRPL